MAFEVAPTSGGNEFIISANILNSSAIDNINYKATVCYSTASGSCPSTGSSTCHSQTVVDALVVTGSVTVPISVVPGGSCRTWTLNILQVSNDTVVDSSNAFVDKT